MPTLLVQNVYLKVSGVVLAPAPRLYDTDIELTTPASGIIFTTATGRRVRLFINEDIDGNLFPDQTELL